MAKILFVSAGLDGVSGAGVGCRIHLKTLQNLMMFFTGFTRFLSDVQKANKVSDKEKYNELQQMYELVDEAE